MTKVRRLPVFLLGLSLVVVVFFYAFGPATAAPAADRPQRTVENAWDLAARLGAFSYQTRLEQTVQPLPSLENAGLGSSTDSIYVEGRNNLNEDEMSMRIWFDGQSALNASSSLEVSVSDGRTRGRLGDGEWQDLDDISQLIAPGRDNLGFLAAAKNTHFAAQETRSGVTFDRYTFDMDGDAFARYMRRQMEDELARRGALPPGVHLDMSDQYQDLIGQGEFWVDEQGLPLRLVTDMILPAAELEQTTVRITTDFSDWDRSLAAKAVTWQGQLSIIDPAAVQQGALKLAVGAGVTSLMLFVFQRIGRRRSYAVIIGGLILLIVISPLLQATSVQAAYDRLDEIQARRERYASQRGDQRTAPGSENSMASDFDPLRSPLSANNSSSGQLDLLTTAVSPPAQTTPTEVDTDQDGLTDGVEANLCTSPTEPDTDRDGLSDGLEMDPAGPGTDPCVADTDGDGLSDRVEALELETDPTDIDTDGDLISDKTEVQGFTGPNGKRLYLDATSYDSNGDGRHDGIECSALVDSQLGFDGKTAEFITGPRLTTSATCSDADSDGVPDVLDRDDDGDGVPDQADIDPTGAVKGSKKDPSTCVNDYNCWLGMPGNTFNLSVSDYNINKPLLTDFQIRPENPDHLQYMLHVLDWPDGDDKGQITTGTGNTFGNSGPAANGDLRLFPLLELKIPSDSFTYPSLPKLTNSPTITATTPITAFLDTTLLDEFGIIFRKNDVTTGDLLAYVPLNMVQDPVSGDPVAFNGRMAYQPHEDTWGSAHTARLVWMVEVINDNNQAQFVHVYEDEWILTGLTVREDHGVEVAIAYEDPVFAQAQTGYDATTYVEQNLWKLADGLANSFVLGRTDNNGNRDITVNEIGRRWDKSSNSGNGLSDGDDELWGIPKSALYVYTQTLAHQGQLGVIPGEVNRILSNTFTSVASQGVVTSTVVTIAREEQVRLANLTDTTGSSTTAGSGSVSFLNVDKEHYVATQMAAYTYGTSWEPFAANDYWQKYFRPRQQQDLNQGAIALLGPDADTKTTLAYYAYAYSNFASHFAGLHGLVQRGLRVYEHQLSVPDGVLTASIAGSLLTPGQIGTFSRTTARLIITTFTTLYFSDSLFADSTRNVRFATNKLKITELSELNALLNGVVAGPVVDAADQMKRLNWWRRLMVEDKMLRNHMAKIADGISGGRTPAFLTGVVYSRARLDQAVLLGQASAGYDVDVLVPRLELNTKKAYGLTALGLLVVGGVYTIAHLSGAGENVGENIFVTFTVLNAINQMITIYQSSRQIHAVGKSVQNAANFLDRAKTATILVANQVSRMAKVTAALGAILEVLVAVGLFIGLAISAGLDLTSRLGIRAIFNLVGTIAVSVLMFALSLVPGIGVILVAVISLVDAILSVICTADKESDPDDFACQGISGFLAKAIGAVFYGFQVVVDPANDNLVTTGQPSFTLNDEARGFTEGNSFNMTLPVTATLYKNGVNSLGTLVNPDFFSDSNAKKSTFDFDIINSDVDRSVGLNSNQYAWNDLPKNDRLSQPDFRGSTTATGVATLGAAGANTLVRDAYFSMSYAIPGQECITAICLDYTEQQTFNAKMADLAFDVLPATLDGFLDMSRMGNAGGYSFSWGRDEGLPFPVFRDADGDGVASKAKGGLDPNDGRADNDADLLSDYYELRAGLDPNDPDTDGDGLTDYDELYYGTDATLPDSDGDGLQDDDEVRGWGAVLGGVDTWVWSDPWQADADEDGYADSVERAYGFNPNMANRGDILDVDTSFEEWIDVPAVAPCSTLTVNSFTVQTAVRDVYEPLEFNDAEIAVLINGRRVWFREGLTNNSTATVNVFHSFCNGQAEIELVEIDQGAWSDDLIGTVTLDAGDSGATTVLESGSQGSRVSLTYSMAPYSNPTVPVLVPSDGFVARGQTINTVSTVQNELQNRNALGLLSVETPSGWDATELYEQPFVLPPNQSETIRAALTVDSGISQSGSYDVTTVAGALMDPDINPANVARETFTPTVHLTFDTADTVNGTYNNVAPGATAVIDNVSYRNPIAVTDGALREAANFSRFRYHPTTNKFLPQGGQALHVNDDTSNSLALNGGSFTLSGWIKRSEEIETSGAIAGYMPALDKSQAYPTLYVDGQQIGIYFGNGSSVCDVKTTSGPLVQNMWQHVAATFDATTGQVKIFLDGQRIHLSSCSQRPTQESEFWIGRATVQDQATLTQIYVEDNGDCCGVTHNRLTGFFGQLWNSVHVEDDEWWRDINATVTIPGDSQYFYKYTQYDMGLSGNDTDDIFTGSFSNSYVLGPDDVSYAELKSGDYRFDWVDEYYDNTCDLGGCGSIYFTHQNLSKHFFEASLDDIRLYKAAVSEEFMTDIYLSAGNALELRLDEAPGAYKQLDYSGSRNDAYCEGTACPKSGIPGRSSRALEFDGFNDLVVMDSAGTLRLNESQWTVAAWVKPAGSGALHHILATDGSNPALALRLPNRKPRIQMGSSFLQADNAIPLDQWTHVAFVRDGGTAMIFVNGVAVKTGSMSGAVSSTAPVYLGGNLLWGNTFTGLLDQVTIRPAAMGQTEIQDLIREAPILHMPFDDPAGSRRLVDVAGNTEYGTSDCIDLRRFCPILDQDGQQYGAIRSNRDTFYLFTGTPRPIDSDWTYMAWVKPDSLREQFIWQDYALPESLNHVAIGSDGRINFGACMPHPFTLTPGVNKVLPGAWNHVALTYDHANHLVNLYLNGSLDKQLSVSPTGCTTPPHTVMLMLGRDNESLGQILFGEMDEFAIYAANLDAKEIRRMFEYQAAWIDSSSTASLVVDVDKPTATLASGGALAAANPTIAISATDQLQAGALHSGVASVEYNVDGGGWQQATPDGAIWLFTLDTSIKGGTSYAIQVRATDNVGNVSAISSGSVVVDNTAPTVSLSSATVVDSDTVDLLGTAGDANGVSSVRVDIIDHDGRPAASEVAATISGSGSSVSWSASYTTPLPLYGTYSVALMAVDGPGNVNTATASVNIDQTPAVAFLTDIGGTEGVIAGVGGSQPVIRGHATDMPLLPNESLQLQFEESTAPYYDSSTKRNHATCSACPIPVAGQTGQAADFDGADDILLVANANGQFDDGLDIEGDITLAAWIKPNSLSGERVIIGRGLDADNQLFLRLNGGEYQAGAIQAGIAYVTGHVIPSGDLNQWVHLAGVYNGSEWLLYRNGEIVSRSHASVGAFAAGENWTVGGNAFGGGYFDGLVDGLFIYDRQVGLSTIRAMAEPVLSSDVSVVEIGLLHLRYIDTPTQTAWHPATLDQTNALYSTWSLQIPTGIEGPYRLSLRTTDGDGNVAVKESVWTGEIDTSAPSATLSYWDQEPNRGAFYACDVSDYNLTLEGITCPVNGRRALAIREYQDAQWFTDLYSPTQKLKRAATDGGRWLRTRGSTPSLTACDLYGNCTTAGATPGSAPPVTTSDAISSINDTRTNPPAVPLLAPMSASSTVSTTVRIEAPAAESGFDSLSSAITISGFVASQSFPVTVTVEVDGASIHSQSWMTSTTNIETWSTDWSPTAPGIFELSAVAVDNLGSVVSDTDTTGGEFVPPHQIYASDRPPSISIDASAALINVDDFLPGGDVQVTGIVSDVVGVQSIEARFNNQPWHLMVVSSDVWSGALPYPSTTIANNESFTLTVRGTNLTGLTTAISNTVTVDLVPPDAFTATLSYFDSGYVPIGANETVSAVSDPGLKVDWTAASDPSGIGPYAVFWFNIEPNGTLTELFTETTTSRSSTYSGSEGQRLLVEIVARDAAGNERTATAGPIYLDDSLTPAYVDMAEFGRGDQPYRNWTAESCNTLGIDNRRMLLSGDLSGVSEQGFYATWDATGLRLAWRGANWDVDGDLFIYLDTIANGSDRLHNPYSATADNTLILLPPGMEADYAIWVQDANTASLLSWNGSAWIDSGQSFTFFHENDLPESQSDLYVPFASLESPSTLSIVAVASEENALRLWAAMPNNNSLNSKFVVPGSEDQPAHLFSLNRKFSFNDLGNGVCPSSGVSHLNISAQASSDAAVIAYSQLSDDLFFVMPQTLSGLRDWSGALGDLCATAGDARLCDRPLIGNPPPAALDFDARSALGGVVSLDHTAVGPGRIVDIVVDISNQSLVAADSLKATVAVTGPLQLVGSSVITMPILLAGETTSITIQVQADSSPSAQWGSVDIVLYDELSGGIGDPLEWVFVDVEVDDGPPILVMLDPSLVAFNDTLPPRLFGTYVDQSRVDELWIGDLTTPCVNESDRHGYWECSRALGGAYLRGSDVYGYTSDNQSSPYFINLQDRQAPTIELGLDSQAIFDDNIVNRTETSLQGTVSDAISAVAVDVCQVVNGDEECQPATVQSDAGSVKNFSYGDQQPSGIAIPACSSPLVRTFDVSESFKVADLDVGLNLDHPFRNDLLVTLTSALGTEVEIVSGGTGAANYSLLIDDTAVADLATDYGDHDTGLLFANPRRPVNELISALSYAENARTGEDAQGTWTLSICDQYPSADHGTYYESKLFFSARSTIAASSNPWRFNLTMPENSELADQVLRIYPFDEAGNHGVPLVYTYTLDTRGPEVTFDTFFSGVVSDTSGIQYMTIKYHGPNGDTIKDEVTLNGNNWSYPKGSTFAVDDLYTIYVEASDFSGNVSTISAYEYFAGNQPPQANDDSSYVTDEDTGLWQDRLSGVLANDTDPDGDRLSAILVTGPSKGILVLNGNGSFSYEPNEEFEYLDDGEFENVAFTYKANDGYEDSNLATVTIRVNGVNDPPEAVFDETTTDEDTPVDIDVLANDTDPEGQALAITYFETTGTVITTTVPDLIGLYDGLITPTDSITSMLTFDPNDDFETMTTGDWSRVWFMYEIADTRGLTATTDVSVTVTGVNDPPVFRNEPHSREVQYSDYITPTTITVYDVDADSLLITQEGLPPDLVMTDTDCNGDTRRPITCTVSISGTMQMPTGVYTATISASDALITATQVITLVVSAENTVLTFDDENPAAVQVTEPESNASLPFELVVYVEELEPDLAAYLGAPGDITLADVSMTLEPVGPGSPVTGDCTPILIDDVSNDYGDVLKVVCAFDAVPVNTYSVNVLVDGGYYDGYRENVIVIYDPSLGFTTGGGWFYWPGTADPANNYPGDKTHFGYSMSYNKGNLRNVKGSLLVIRHAQDGSMYRLKSNALDRGGLAIGDVGFFGWASFTGKATYVHRVLETDEPEGNHTFLVYVEDHDEPGKGIDEFWLETRDKDGLVIPDLSMPRPGSENAEQIGGGNIVVPHSGGTGNNPPTADFGYITSTLTVTFTDQSSDPGGSIDSWEWDFGDGNSSTEQHPTHTYAAAGDYDVTLTVTDNDGAQDTTAQVVTVSGPNEAPTAGFSYTTNGPTADFSDTSSNPDGDNTIVSWDWDFGDGMTSTLQSPSHSYATGGTYNVSLTVTDDQGASDTTSQDVTVTGGNQDPTAGFIYSAITRTVSFTDTSGDPDGFIAGWSWDFGDGNSSTEQNPEHTYAFGGTYDVVLTVTDNNGATDTLGQQITVSGGAGPSEMDVYSLAGDSSPGNRNRWNAEVTIRIVDDQSNGVANAQVSGSWSAGASGSGSCQTDANGFCTVNKNSIGKNRGSVTFTVNDVSHASLSHNPSLYPASMSITISRPAQAAAPWFPAGLAPFGLVTLFFGGIATVGVRKRR